MACDGHHWLRMYLGHDPARARVARRALRVRCQPITVQIDGWRPYFAAALLKMPTITSSTSTAAMHAHHEAHISDRLPCVRIALRPHVSRQLLTTFAHRGLAAHLGEYSKGVPQLSRRGGRVAGEQRCGAISRRFAAHWIAQCARPRAYRRVPGGAAAVSPASRSPLACAVARRTARHATPAGTSR